MTQRKVGASTDTSCLTLLVCTFAPFWIRNAPLVALRVARRSAPIILDVNVFNYEFQTYPYFRTDARTGKPVPTQVACFNLGKLTIIISQLCSPSYCLIDKYCCNGFPTIFDENERIGNQIIKDLCTKVSSSLHTIVHLCLRSFSDSPLRNTKKNRKKWM